MATRNATLATDVNGETQYIYPKTTSDIVEYTEDMSVKEKLDELENAPGVAYGTCSSASGTVNKVVTCEGFTLQTGSTINVYFTNSNTSFAPTLNVNSTGAKNIHTYGTTTPGTSTWRAGSVVSFTYDGTNWVINNGSIANTTYYGITKLTDSVSNSSSELAATANAVKTAYDAAEDAKSAADEAKEAAAEAMEYAEDNKYTHPTVTANNTTSTASPEHGSTFTAIDTVTRDTMGHVTGVNTKTITLPSATENTGTTYSAGTGISISNDNVINHSNSITAGSISGSSGNIDYGGTINIPSITYDSEGHITGTSTTTMTMPDANTVATQLGTSTVGSGTNPIYLNNGVATVSTSTVGSGIKPVYLDSGIVTVSNSTVGDINTPVYLSNGTITECTGVAKSADVEELSDTVDNLSEEVEDLKENTGSPAVILSAAGCNGFYMEGDLGTVTIDNVDDFCDSYGIGNRTRKDIYIGCHFTAKINGSDVIMRAAAFDHELCNYRKYGSQGLYHVTFVPDSPIISNTCAMNSSATTSGAYYGSRMNAGTIPTIDGYLQNVFGSHLVQFYNYIPSSVDTSMTNYNYPSFTGVVNDHTLAYYYSILMSEIEVWGTRFYSCCNGSVSQLMYMPDRQLPLFRLNPKLIVAVPVGDNGSTYIPASPNYSYWLRDIASSSYFCGVGYLGCPFYYGANYSYYVRPRFSLA